MDLSASNAILLAPANALKPRILGHKPQKGKCRRRSGRLEESPRLKVLPIVEDAANETIRLLDLKSKQPYLNIHPFFHEYTMDVIARVALGHTETTQQNIGMEYSHHCMQSLKSSPRVYSWTAWCVPAIGPLVYKAIMLRSRLRKAGFAILTQKTAEAVRERKAARVGELRDCATFVQMLLLVGGGHRQRDFGRLYRFFPRRRKFRCGRKKQL